MKHSWNRQSTKFNTKFLNKDASRPVRAKNVFSQLQIDLVDMRNQLIKYKNKVYQYILSIMDIFGISLVDDTPETKISETRQTASKETF